MITFGIKSDIDEVSRAFDVMGKDQVPFATSLAMNRTAQLVQKTLITTMRSIFDRPTPFILNSTFIASSTKSRLQVTIGHKDASGRIPSSAFVKSEIEGGSRLMKASEKALGHYYAPSKNVSLDQYGNVPGSVIKQIMSALGDGGTGKLKGQEIFVMQPNNPRGLKPGVYQRLKIGTKTRHSALAGGKVALQSGGKLKPILFFETHSPQYTQRYDFEGVVARVWQAEYSRQFESALDYALANPKTT